MLRVIKNCFWIILLAAGLQRSWGFSLLGPLPPDPGGEPWQVVDIGYVQGYFQSGAPGGLIWLGDIGGPHNIGEGYRRNVPVIYYSYDASFTGFQTDVYFGTNGMAAIDSAFGIINSLTNVDSYSRALTEFPLHSQHFNYEAQSLYLTDLKSVTLHLAVEQLGLADPARYSWTLHERFPGNTCPVTTEYLVVQRNFDGTSAASDLDLAYSPYVNGQLLTYYITEHCTGPPPALATTVPYLTDPAGGLYEPVAANNAEQLEEFDTQIASSLLFSTVPTIYGLQIGGYYTGLTRDDVAGLRYLFTTNNIDLEPIAASSVLFSVVTNFTQQALFPSVTSTNITGTNGGFYTFDGTYGYGDYGFLVATSITNSPVVLQALYPGLVIASSSNYFGYVTNWVYTQYLTNAGYGSAFPPPQILVTVSNPVVSLQGKFLTTFANVFTNNVHPTTTYQLQTITVTNLIGAPFGSAPVTNTTVQYLTRNVPSGDFFVLPLFHTNVCPIDFLYTGLTNLLAVTNVLTTTNLLTTTGASNSFSSTVLQINYVATNQWVVHPLNCAEVSNAPSLYQGVGGVKFQRVDYDSLTGIYTSPVTNYYTMVELDITNSQLVLQHLVRVVTQPDIVLAAQDLALGPAAIPFNNTVIRNINFNSSQEIAGLHGPGIIDQSLATPTTFIYNKVGPIFVNGPFRDGFSFINPTEVNQTTQIPLLQWASFDGSTNPPVLYPNTSSLQNLESQIVIQLTTTPGGPLVGTNGTPYSVQFSATGGAVTPPFTWSATGYPVGTGILYGLPPGLTVSSNGLLSGTPTSSGTYDFVLILTDTYGRSVQWNLSITIN